MLVGKVYSNSPSDETAMSPRVREARVVRSLRAWVRDIPASVARSVCVVYNM